jgi:hypothetical protein
VREASIRPTIKIYGERNTGTNYLLKLFRRNLEVDLLRGVVPWYIRIPFPQSELARDLYFALTSRRNLGWKHCLAPLPGAAKGMRGYKDSLLFVTLTKNPYSWLLSLYRHPHHYRSELGTFQQFLNAPWKTVRRENTVPAYPNPVIMWNEKNSAYLRLNSGVPTANVRYEDLLAHPEQVLVQLATRHSIDRIRPDFENVIASTKEREGAKDFDYYQEYYLREQWKTELQASTLHTINRYLNFDLMRQFGYEKLEAV